MNRAAGLFTVFAFLVCMSPAWAQNEPVRAPTVATATDAGWATFSKAIEKGVDGFPHAGTASGGRELLLARHRLRGRRSDRARAC